MKKKILSSLKLATFVAALILTIIAVFPPKAQADIARNCEYTGMDLDVCTAEPGYAISKCKNEYGPKLLRCSFTGDEEQNQ